MTSERARKQDRPNHSDRKKARRNGYLRALRAAQREQILQVERARREELKQRIIEYLGGVCARCKRSAQDFGHTAALDCHHRDWRTKSYNIAANYSRGWDSLVVEVRKCQLLCASCHRVLTALEEQGRVRGRPTFASTAHKGNAAGGVVARYFADLFEDDLRRRLSNQGTQLGLF